MTLLCLPELFMTGMGEVQFIRSVPHVTETDTMITVTGVQYVERGHLIVVSGRHMLARDLHMIVVVSMSRKTAVSPHKIAFGTMTAGIELQTIWSGPHMTGVGPITIEKEVGKVGQVKSATPSPSMLIKGKKINWSRGNLL